MILAVLFFFAITTIWFLLPFAPGLNELRRREDADPLHVASDSDVDIRHFERGFRNFIDTYLRGTISTCENSGVSAKGTLEDGTQYLVISDDDPPLLIGREERMKTSERLLIACADLSLPGDRSFLGEIYTAGELRGGANNIYRAILADGAVRLSRESTVLRWVHSHTDLSADEECVLYGRASADDRLSLSRGCVFERMNAARIEFGPVVPGREQRWPARDKLTRIKPEDLPKCADVSAGRVLINGDLTLRPNSLVDIHLIVTGKLTIGKGSRLEQSVKSHRDMTIEEGVRIEGGAFSGKRIRIADGCTIGGPLLSEGDIEIGADVMIGTPEKPTTLSVAGAEIREGAVAHGEVWAHEYGRLVAGRSGADTQQAAKRGTA